MVFLSESVEEIRLERDAELLASFLQAEKGVTSLPPVLTSGSGTDFSFFDIVANIVFAEIIVERNLGPSQRQQEGTAPRA